MLKDLIVLVWPVGIAGILAITALFARRVSGRPALAGASANGAPTNGHHLTTVSVGQRSTRSSIIGMLLILAVGAVAVYGLTCLLGLFVVHVGPNIDKPIYNWMIHHRVHFWKSAMDRATKIGDTWTTWGAAVAAAVCLTAFYRK